MVKRKHKEQRFYKYKCSITGESFTVTREAPNSEELVSVRAYYELNPEKDDRPEVVKTKLGDLEPEMETEEEEVEVEKGNE